VSDLASPELRKGAAQLKLNSIVAAKYINHINANHLDKLFTFLTTMEL
jgi:hypothetical protein